jgi:hypothetical protein
MSAATFAQPIGEWKEFVGVYGTQGQSYPGVSKLLEYKNELYLLGNFNKIGTDTSLYAIAKMNTNRSISSVGGGLVRNDGKAGNAMDAIVFNGALYVGGDFHKAGTIPVTGFAKWDGTNWTKIDLVFESYDDVRFILHNNTIYLAKKKKVFKLNGSTFEEVITTNVDIKGIASWNNRLFLAGGSFKLKDNTNAYAVVEVVNGELVKVADFHHNAHGVNIASSSALASTPSGLVFNGLISTINGDSLSKYLYIYNGTTFKHLGGGVDQAPGALDYHSPSNRLFVYRLNRGAFEENGTYVDGYYNLYRDMNTNTWKAMCQEGKRAGDYIGILGNTLYGFNAYFREIMYYTSSVPTSISNIYNTSQKIQCYPNPSNGVFNFTSTQKMVSCNVYDAAGRLCNNYQWSNNSIDLKGLERGLYYIHMIDTKGNSYTSKVQLSL